MSIASSTSAGSTAVSAPVLRVEGLAGLFRQRMADYSELCRPRIALMTMISVAVGFTLASPILFETTVLLVAITGIVQLVAASSILNQSFERHTDSRMKRTSQRPIAAGRIPVLEAIFVSALLTCSGSLLLWKMVNPATALATAATLVVYVLGYTMLKNRTSLCTTVGAVPGAMPPVLGWLAAGGSLNIQALALFALFFVWQFPHFLAIGWIHREDYQQAGLRMLPSFSDGGQLTGIIAVIYAIAFVPVSLLPASVGLSGRVYWMAALVLSITYLVYSIRFSLDRSEKRARKLLYNSLLCLPLLLLALVIDFLRLTAMG